MQSKYSVKLKTVAEELRLNILHAPKNFDEVFITTKEVNRPGLQFAGYYAYFDPRRLQIMGRVEYSYLQDLSSNQRNACFECLFSKQIVALVICRGVPLHPEGLEMAIRYGIPVLQTDIPTSEFVSNLIGSLNLHLAPRETRHGGLIEVHGEGLLLLGESGIGKSETALELIKRGHRLIADDAVEIKRTSRVTLVGSAPEMIRYYMELRGIGVIDARNIFGVGSVKPAEKIDLIVHMETWEQGKAYDRLGIDAEYTNILGVNVPSIIVPVRPGRNLAVILELAAMNNRQKKMGYNAALTLAENHDKMIDNGGQ